MFNVKMKSCERVDSNPNMPDNWSADHWKCILVKDNRRMTVYFSKGYAHGGAEPSVPEILECLVMDGSGSDNFEEWCDEYGYDTDSRSALKTFNAVQKQVKKLEQFMAEDFDALVQYEF